MNKVITMLNASNYHGQFNLKTFNGSFSTDGARNIQSISGGNADLGSFEAHSNGLEMVYVLRPVGIEKAEELAASAKECVDAVKGELATMDGE